MYKIIELCGDRNSITGCNDRVHISTVHRVGRHKKPSYFLTQCNGSAADRFKKSK